MLSIWPDKCASPWSLRATGGVSRTACAGVAELHTRHPVTAVIGPGVPLTGFPTITRPSTSKEAAPVARFTRARPSRADQGTVPLEMFPTGLLRPSLASVVASSGAVITPTILFQRTIVPLF